MSTLGKTFKNVTKHDVTVSSMHINSSSFRQYGGDFWLLNQAGGIDYHFTYASHNSSLTAYTKCSPLTAIINRKAQAHINGRTWITNIGGKGKNKEATNEAAKKLRALIARPNPTQSWKQFEAQQKIYMQLFGFCLVLPIIPIGFTETIDATSLWNIPPYMLDIEETNRLFYQTDTRGIIKSIKLIYKDTESYLDVNNVYFFKDFTPSFNSLVIPESRVRSLEDPINNIIGAYKSRNVLINYRGALGIISNDQKDSSGYIPMKEDDKESLQKEFLRYGLQNTQWKFIISQASVKWQQMGVPTKDLMLFEEVVDSSKAICDGYGYPPHLMGLIDPTFNNQQAAEKGLYQNTIIPEAESMYEEWNNLFRLSQYNIRMEKDFSQLPVLQEDDAKMATARKTRNEALQIEFYTNLITLNRWLEINGEDPRTDSFGDMYYYQLVEAGWKFGNTGAKPANSNEQNQNENNEQQNQNNQENQQ